MFFPPGGIWRAELNYRTYKSATQGTINRITKVDYINNLIFELCQIRNGDIHSKEVQSGEPITRQKRLRFRPTKQLVKRMFVTVHM